MVRFLLKMFLLIFLGFSLNRAEIKASTENILPLVSTTKVHDENNSEYKNSKKEFLDYFTFVKGGENLQKSCENNLPPAFANLEEERRAILMIMTSLQYVGLKFVTYSLKAYARELNLSESEVKNMANYLTSNYCSPNMTIISRKEISKNIWLDYKNEKYKVYSFGDSPFYSPQMNSFDGDNSKLKADFVLLAKMFRAFCSFGNDEERPRFLVPFLQSKAIMSYIINGMVQEKWQLKDRGGKLKLESFPEGIQVLCGENICRRTSDLKFKENFPRVLGQTNNIREDLERTYCHKVKNVTSNTVGELETVKKWMMRQTDLEDLLMVDFFIALINKVPSFVTKIHDFSSVLDVLLYPFDDEWDLFASESLKSLSTDLSFEESVSFEPHKNQVYDDGNEVVFRFDVNLGEWDRMQEDVGKLKISFDFEINESVIFHVLKKIPQVIDEKYDEIWDQNVEYLSLFLKHPLEKLKSRFFVPPWKGDFSMLLGDLLLQKALELKKRNYSFSPSGSIQKRIKIHIFYAPYALKYFNYEFKSKLGASTIDFF